MLKVVYLSIQVFSGNSLSNWVQNSEGCCVRMNVDLCFSFRGGGGACVVVYGCLREEIGFRARQLSIRAWRRRRRRRRGKDDDLFP